MIILEVDQEKFAYSYIEKHTGEQPPKGVKALSDYLESLDKAFYKRMMTAYRVDKKRRLDKEAGNASVNVVLSQDAHKRLKAFADNHGVTLSHFIEHFMNNGFIASEQNLKNENDILKAQLESQKRELENLKQKNKELKAGDKDLSKRNDSLWETIQVCRKEKDMIQRFIREVYGDDIKDILSEFQDKAALDVRLSNA